MKSSYLKISGILIHILLSFPILGQNIAFPDSFAMWYDKAERACGSFQDLSFFSVQCHTFEMNGDTVLSSKSYNKVYLYNDSTQNKSFYVGMRSDTSNRVFVFIPEDNQEYIIYDFTFVEGDTVILTYPYYDYQSGNVLDTSMLIIGEVDTVFLYGEMRRRARVRPKISVHSYASYWIEGVGSSHGLLYYELESNQNKTCEYCKWLSDFSLSRDINTNCLDTTCFWVGINDVSTNTFKIFPNPTSETLYLKSSQSFQSIQILSLSGKEMLFTNERAINVSELAKGLYLVKVNYKNGESLVRKVVVE